MTVNRSMKESIALAERIVTIGSTGPDPVTDARTLAFAVLRLESALQRASLNDRTPQYAPGERRRDGRAPDAEGHDKRGRWRTPREIAEAIINEPPPVRTMPTPGSEAGDAAMAVERSLNTQHTEGDETRE